MRDWNKGIMEDWNNGIMGKDVASYELQVNPLRLTCLPQAGDSLTIRKNVVQCCCSKNKG